MSTRFDQKAQELDAHPIIREIAHCFAQTLSHHLALSQDDHLLDYGCGSGLIGMHLYPFVSSITMMDRSEGMLNILEEKIRRDKIINMEILKCELETSGIGAETFDVIYMNNVLHHIGNISPFLQLATRMLKTDGHLCIGDIEKEDGSFHEDNSDVRHFGFDAQEIDAFLSECNLKKLKSERYYTVNRPNRSGEMEQYPLFFTTAVKI
jgi:putative AdoMet-dependent methyltransferase